MDTSEPVPPSTGPSGTLSSELLARPGGVVIGAAGAGRQAAFRCVEYAAAMTGITARLVWHGSAPIRALVPQRAHVMARDATTAVDTELRSRVSRLADRGAAQRQVQVAQVSGLLDRLVPAIVAEVVARVDVTRLVAEHVDLDALAATIDLDAIVDRLDLAAITDDVLDEIDLPEIIRESTGSLGNATVATLRLRGVDADEAVSKVVDRVLRRDRR